MRQTKECFKRWLVVIGGEVYVKEFYHDSDGNQELKLQKLRDIYAREAKKEKPSKKPRRVNLSDIVGGENKTFVSRGSGEVADAKFQKAMKIA